MAGEEAKMKDLEDTRRPDLFKSARKRPLTELLDMRDKGWENAEKGLFKGKEPLKLVRMDSVRSSSEKNLVKVGTKFAKGNGREQEGEAREKNEAKLHVKVLNKEEEKANGKEQGKVNGREHGKELGKVNGKDSGDVRDLIRDRVRVKEKGKSPIVKSALVKIRVKQGSIKNAILKSINARTSTSLGLSLKKKVIIKTLTEKKKEKKFFSLPGQRHDPPNDKDALKVFYLTLRDQMPKSKMAEIWLMEYGLLPQDQAKKALERKQRRGQSFKHGVVLSKMSSTGLQLSDGSLEVKKSLVVSKGKGKGIGTYSKGKKKSYSDSESDNYHDLLRKARMKKKLKA